MNTAIRYPFRNTLIIVPADYLSLLNGGLMVNFQALLHNIFTFILYCEVATRSRWARGLVGGLTIHLTIHTHAARLAAHRNPVIVSQRK